MAHEQKTSQQKIMLRAIREYIGGDPPAPARREA